MAKDKEEVGEKMVTVLRPVAAGGMSDGGGWTEIELPESVALEQLSKPPAKRNAHWKHAKIKELTE